MKESVRLVAKRSFKKMDLYSACVLTLAHESERSSELNPSDKTLHYEALSFAL